MPKDNALKRFGKNIRDRREALGLSQEALAEKAELDRTYIGGVERGERKATLETLGRHGRVLRFVAPTRPSSLRTLPIHGLAPFRIGRLR
jgi:transcriptional regulator with XRE-family HTH domain